MTLDTDNRASVTPPAASPAVWPWLLLPLVTLTLYYVLSTVKRAPDAHPAHHAEAPADRTPSDELESH